MRAGGNGNDSSADAAAANGPRRPGQLIAESTLSNKVLLDVAFVNMQKGIGRGW